MSDRIPEPGVAPSADVHEVPLCVALRGGLLPAGFMVEELFALVRARPEMLLRLPVILAGGIRGLRRHVESHALRNVAGLPFDPMLLEELRRQRSAGRSLVLYAPDTLLGPPIARHLGFFEEVVDGRAGSSDAPGPEPAARYGAGGFDFLGGHPADVEAAAAARHVRDPFSEREPLTPRVLLRALRAHQWLKNILIFLPVLAGQRLTDPEIMGRATLAFVAFCLLASSVYVVNDLFDVKDDRRHPTKQFRPFASGRLPVSAGPALALLLASSGIAISVLLLPFVFTGVLALYGLISLAYSLKLKGAVLIDVLTLAGLYTLRVVAGSAATGIDLSVWLLGFSLFFFLSLAMVKRYAELYPLREDAGPTTVLPGRSYQPRDLPVLVALGVGAGCMSVLVLALYVINDEFVSHYTRPTMLWLLCPLALYWIGRAWIVVAREEMHDDPLVWAVKDQLSRWVAIAAVVLLLLAR